MSSANVWGKRNASSYAAAQVRAEVDAGRLREGQLIDVGYVGDAVMVRVAWDERSGPYLAPDERERLLPVRHWLEVHEDFQAGEDSW